MMVAFLPFFKRLGGGALSNMMLLLLRLLLWLCAALPSCGWLQICGSLTKRVMRGCTSGSLVSRSSAWRADGRSSGESLSRSLTRCTTGSSQGTFVLDRLHLRPPFPVDEELLASDLHASRQHLLLHARLADVVSEDPA
jgi:hypothetical protein